MREEHLSACIAQAGADRNFPLKFLLLDKRRKDITLPQRLNVRLPVVHLNLTWPGDHGFSEKKELGFYIPKENV